MQRIENGVQIRKYIPPKLQLLYITGREREVSPMKAMVVDGLAPVGYIL